MAQPVTDCRRSHGAHDWHLRLLPARPDWVTVQCARCLTSLNSIWPGATNLIFMDVAGFHVPGWKVENGWHTATYNVDLPVDLFIRSSERYNVQAHTFETEIEVQVTPRSHVLEAGQSET